MDKALQAKFFAEKKSANSGVGNNSSAPGNLIINREGVKGGGRRGGAGGGGGGLRFPNECACMFFSFPSPFLF